MKKLFLIPLLLLAAFAADAQIKISSLPVISSPTGLYLVVNQTNSGSGSNQTCLLPIALLPTGSATNVFGINVLGQGNGNFFVGPAGNQTLSGYYNFAAGAGALTNVSSGWDNVAASPGALANDSIGSFNDALGVDALFQNTTGSNNIAFGTLAGFFITSGSSNIDIGNEGVTGDTNIVRIGSGQSATYLPGILNIPTLNVIGTATNNGETDNGVLNANAGENIAGTLNINGGITLFGGVTLTGGYFSGSGLGLTGVPASSLFGSGIFSGDGSALTNWNHTVTGIATNVLSVANLINMAFPTSDYFTNASFNFSAVANYNPSAYPSAVIYVHNTTGTVFAIGPYGAWRTNGVWNVTNESIVTISGDGQWATNAACLPVY